MATKKTSAKFDTAHNIETEADLTNKTAIVKNLVTGETYQGEGGGSGLPDISEGDAGKVLAVSNELAAEWASPIEIIPCNGNSARWKVTKTISEINALMQQGKLCYIDTTNIEDWANYLALIAYIEGSVTIAVVTYNGIIPLPADNDGYPEYSD